MRTKIYIAVAAAIALGGVSVAEAAAQMDNRTSFEVRGTAMVPTFDIADAANLGWGGGAGLGYRASERVRLMADFDIGIHDTDTPDFNINTLHYMGKVGYDVVSTDKVVLTLNLGAGAVTFAGDLPTSQTYFAINAGAKLGVKLTPSAEFLISPQGDIAFSDEAELGTTNAWVWPFSVGFRLSY